MGKKKLRYYPKAHTYWVGKKKLDSVTTFIGNFFEPFDQRAVARKLAKYKHNKKAKRGVRYWLNEWKQSREFGSMVHAQIETILKHMHPIKEASPFTRQAIKWIRDKREDIDYRWESELQLYDEELRLAGTVDFFYIDQQGKTNLVDWKTNKKLRSEGYEGKTGVLPPTETVQDCHISKYGLQLSFYAYMLERQGHDIGKLLIIHLTEDGAEEIEVAYLKDKVEEMLAYFGRVPDYDMDNSGGE